MTSNKYQIYKEPVSNIEEYLLLVALFVTDPKMNPNQDLDFFVELIFDSKWGHIHTRFCRYFLVKNEDYLFTFEAISKFLEFLSVDSVLFTNDFFHTLCSDYPSVMVEKVFNNLPNYLKHQSLEVLVKYDKIVSEIPRIKTYMVFS